MPYTEVTITHPRAATERYALCDTEKCRTQFSQAFGIASLDVLPLTRDEETIQSERIFEDSHTFHADCFMCAVTVWCGSDCARHRGV